MNGPLKVPATERTQHLLFDANSKKLANEIKDLPYVDIPTALMLAYRKLHTFNRFALSPAKRLQLVGPFHYAFSRFIEYYRNQMQGSIFSKELDSNEQENLLDFIQELGFAYKHIIQDTLAKNKRPGGFATALYMAMNYQYYHGLLSYNRGRMLKGSHWRDIHYLYFLARELGQEDKEVSTPDERNVTLASLYKRCVLVGLASPHSMTTEDQWRASDYITRYANMVDLVPAQNQADTAEAYWVNPECVLPANIPNSEGSESSEPGLILDLSKLLDSVHRHYQSVRMGESLRSVQLKQMPRQQAVDLLNNLYNQWSRNTHRQHERYPIDEEIGLVWGLENICNMLDPELRRLAIVHNSNAGSDQRAWSHGSNESKTGIRVRLSGSSTRFPQAGQIVAMIRKKGRSKALHLGMVRWAAISRDESPHCGLKLLTGTTTKVSIHRPDEDLENRNGLLVWQKSEHHGRTQALIVAPNGLLKADSETRIHAVGHHEPYDVRVNHITHRSRHVDVFSVDIIEY